MSGRQAGRREPPPTPVAALDELIAVARRFGRDPEFARGGGGNASVKVDGVLYIKPSGVALATLAADDLVPLDVEPLLALLHAGDRGAEAAGPGGPAGPADTAGAAGPAHATGDLTGDPVMRTALAARLADAGGRRPSVELLFHAFLPERLVLHTHPIDINAVTCNRDGAALAERLFGERAVWVPYTDPGLPLARAIVEARRAHVERTGEPAPAITVMQNHGIIVGGESAAEIVELSGWLLDTVRAALQRAAVPAGVAAPDLSPADLSPAGMDPARARTLVDVIAPSVRGLLATGTALRVVTFDDAPLAASFTASPAGRDFVLGGPLTPDQIVYAGSWPLLLDLPDEIEPDDVPELLRERLADHAAAHGTAPIIVVVPRLGLFAAGETFDEADTARHVYLDALRVGEGALALGGVRALSAAERTFIEAWEAEAYRREVAAGPAGTGRFAGKVALVTGAAQGFGLAISADLVAEGGHVVLADLNAALAESNARDLEARHGPGRATAVAMNVMDEQSVADGFHATVVRYGGLDVLVSNAGVLRAGAVTSQPLAEFDLVTRVNYRGYFLGVRSAAPIMARQHHAKPDRRSDIIEINSKSGLVGSGRNSAYAGSKFGGIGLTQSFALELVGDGIKVNAICPGNFFDGPLWADQESGLFVQYLRAGKVPGATTIDDVRHFYEAKVPMGRGCTPADVLEALYYLVAQQYETGQALPVTGGQVMLS
jgi:rhamnose utilization protein RhaD (predicted bifunctional aldolase and dehydrogenase)/NAD(P)-dependent dehydrogenase (short-subunit alcohol dehydrogenase family)